MIGYLDGPIFFSCNLFVPLLRIHILLFTNSRPLRSLFLLIFALFNVRIVLCGPRFKSFVLSYVTWILNLLIPYTRFTGLLHNIVWYIRGIQAHSDYSDYLINWIFLVNFQYFVIVEFIRSTIELPVGLSPIIADALIPYAVRNFL